MRCLDCEPFYEEDRRLWRLLREVGPECPGAVWAVRPEAEPLASIRARLWIARYAMRPDMQEAELPYVVAPDGSCGVRAGSLAGSSAESLERLRFFKNRRQGQLVAASAAEESCVCIWRMVHKHARRWSLRYTPAFLAWRALVARAYDLPAEGYSWPYYAGRGVGVCEGWRSFRVFRADVGDRPPAAGVDVDGPYSCGRCSECQANGWPANGRWATPRLDVASADGPPEKASGGLERH